MKKLFSIIAMLLAVAMTTLTATPAFAATKTARYVSDAVIVAADSYDAAKAKLEKDGYMILDGELNPDLDEQLYIGYKTTEDPDEAITDMAVMNMNGPFSYSSYKQILEKQRNTVDAHMKRLIPSIVRYQENYEAGKQSAQLLHDALNCYKEDHFHKTPVLMGDYLADYAGSEEARNELTDVFMRGGSETMLTIEALLAMASESTNDTLAERIAAITEDDMEEHYLEEYDTASAARSGMRNELDDSALYLYNGFAGFREYLRSIKADYLVETADGADINEKAFDECDYQSAYFKDMPEDVNDYINACGELLSGMTQQLMISDITVYATLKMIPYGDYGSLYDFFMQYDEDVEPSDFYPLVYCMNDAQRALLGNIGFKQLVLYTFSDINDADSETTAALREYIDMFSKEPVSVYDGVDLSIFEDGVAFTDETVRHDRLTNDCWLASVLGGETEFDTMFRSTAIATILTAGFGAATIIANKVYRQTYEQAFIEGQNIQNELYTAAEEAGKYIGDAEIYANVCRKKLNNVLNPLNGSSMLDIDEDTKATIELFTNKYTEASEKYRKIESAYNDAIETADKADPKAYAAKAGFTSAIVKNVSLVLTIITAAYDVYSIVHMICAALPEEEPIPHHIVTMVPTKYGDSYVYYAAAKNFDGGYADINNHKDAKLGWLTLYTTKDAFTSPILADDLRVNTGSSFIAPGMSALHMFNEEAACNINDKTYSGSDKDAVYVTFKRDTANYTASAFSRNAVAAVGAGGLLLGAALGVLTTVLVRKRKNDGEDITEAE